jgi:hypothetical protein
VCPQHLTGPIRTARLQMSTNDVPSIPDPFQVGFSPRCISAIQRRTPQQQRMPNEICEQSASADHLRSGPCSAWHENVHRVCTLPEKSLHFSKNDFKRNGAILKRDASECQGFPVVLSSFRSEWMPTAGPHAGSKAIIIGQPEKKFAGRESVPHMPGKSLIRRRRGGMFASNSRSEQSYQPIGALHR